MKRVHIAIVMLFALTALTASDHALRCFRCGQFNESFFTPEECEKQQVIDKCQEDQNLTCANFKTKTTINNVTTEEQVQGCLPRDECTVFSERCQDMRANGAECNFDCCDHDLCNDPDVLTCNQCDGPYTVDDILGLNSSSSLNQTYNFTQCVNDQKVVTCRNGTCSEFLYRRHVGPASLEVEVALRSCITPYSRCDELKNFCRDTNITTEICHHICCNRRKCNKASGVNLMSFYVPFVTIHMFIVFHL